MPDRWEEAYWPFLARRGEPLGRRLVVATQGYQRATAAVNVVPESPSVSVEPHIDQPGATFTIHLRAFQPSQPIALRLYREDDERTTEARNGVLSVAYVYLTAIAEVLIDGQGDGVYNLETEVDDPEGTYRVAVDPAAPQQRELCSEFIVWRRK